MNVQVVPRILGLCLQIIGTLGGHSLKGKTTILRIVNLGSIPGVSKLSKKVRHIYKLYECKYKTNLHT